MTRQYKVGNGMVELVQGSITKYKADALVCPANGDLEILAFPGGLQWAFFVDGGKEIFEEATKVGAEYFLNNPDMKNLGMVPEFSAHLTGAGRLSVKHVIHSVAVGYDKKRKSLYCNGDVLAKSTCNVLNLAKQHNLSSIGFPALGTGLYDVPLEEAVEAMSDEFKKSLEDRMSINRIGLVLYGMPSYNKGRGILDNKFG